MSAQPKTISVTELTPVQAISGTDKRPSTAISRCLQDVLERYGTPQGRLVTLPSLMALGRFFQASHMEVHDALQQLRQHGYDYDLKGMDIEIPFWYTSVCDEASRSFGR